MEILALLSNRDEIVAAVKNSLREYPVYPAATVSELEELLISFPEAIIMLDGFAVKATQAEELMTTNRNLFLILADEGFNINSLTRTAEVVDAKNLLKELPKIVKRMLDRKQLEQEIHTLKAEQKKHEIDSDRHDAPQVIDSPIKRFMHEQVLLNFAKTLTVNFNTKKLLDHFLDSVMEIIRVNKMSIMLRGKNVFKIKAHIGMDPYFVDNIKLTNENSLIKWLAGHGRILSRAAHGKNSLYPNIAKEMELLQCVFSFPMVYKGKLIGVFNIDSKITGDPFYKEELEVIFMLCNYLSAAIKDIDSYHQIQYQKDFTKNILSNMNSGVITINAEERISVFNQRASEILKLNAMDLLGADLRKLPSPLGDMLFETMIEGRSYTRHETTIHPGNVPLGINSYRLTDEDRKPIGAVIVFTDLSDFKKLEEEKRKTEKLEAINNLVGKIAHEIKNPLTSIQTFTQLLDEKYADEEFRRFFSLSVMQSIQQLNSLIDKLALFSSPLDYHPGVFSVNEIISDAVNSSWKDLPQGVRLMKEPLENDLYVRVDRNLFIKALYYLILAAAEKSPKEDFIFLQAVEKADRSEAVEIRVRFSGSPLSEEEKEMLLKPLLDIDAFGIELNVPISQKIIEDLNGTLSIGSGSSGNALVITLPAKAKADLPVQKDSTVG